MSGLRANLWPSSRLPPLEPLRDHIQLGRPLAARRRLGVPDGREMPLEQGQQFAVGAAREHLGDESAARQQRLHREIGGGFGERSEEHTSALQSLMRISYAVFCLKKKNTKNKESNKPH